MYNGKWGGVCDNRWSDTDARVVCKQLGYKTGVAYKIPHFQRSDTPIHMDNVECTGTESNLAECAHDGWGRQECVNHQHAGVICSETDFRLRLVSGRKTSEGRVELMFDGEWGTVCDTYFDNKDAEVVCRELGYRKGVAMRGAYFGQGHGPIYLDGMQCLGTEHHFTDCSHRGWGIYQNCTHHNDASVICSDTGIQVRLYNSENNVQVNFDASYYNK